MNDDHDHVKAATFIVHRTCTVQPFVFNIVDNYKLQWPVRDINEKNSVATNY